MKLSNIFGIRREERTVILVAAVLMVALNGLMVAYNHDLFTRGGNIAYYSLFTKYFVVSGYDDYTYITLSTGKMIYALYRHPLFTPMMYPLYLFNHWQMQYTEMNMAIYIVAAVMVVCGICSFLFLYRILRRVTGLSRTDSFLLTLMFYSFAHVMISSFVPDHFGISMSLLLLTLYAAGYHLRDGSRMGPWKTMLLFLVTSGITLTNGAKTMLAALWCGGRRFFDLRYLSVVFILPVMILSGAYTYQYYTVQLPNERLDSIRGAQRMKTDPKFAEAHRNHEEWKKKHKGTKIIDSELFEWTDKSMSRWDAAVENVFGESIQLHRRYLLQDGNSNRPGFVTYDWWLNYAVEALIILLFAAGLWFGRRDKFIHLCLSWFALDMTLHMVLGFAIFENYIMTAHWIFIIPIAISTLFKSAKARWRLPLRGLIAVITLFLWIYNGTLIVEYLL